MKSVIKLIVSLWLCTLCSDDLRGQDYSPELPISDSGTNSVQLIYPGLVNRFYQINQQKPFWFSDSGQSISLRRALKDVIDSAINIGLDGSKYHYSELLNYTNSNIPDRSISMRTDSIFTEAAIAFFKDVYQGTNVSSVVNAGDVSPK
mgnify:FL=1